MPRQTAMTYERIPLLLRFPGSLRPVKGAFLAVSMAALLAACSGTGSSPSATAAGSGAAACTKAVDGVVKLSAQNVTFDTNCIEVPAGTAFKIEFTNNDSPPHDVAIYNDDSKATELFKGDVVEQGKTVTYDVPALDAGEHFFECTIHPTMSGKVVAQ